MLEGRGGGEAGRRKESREVSPAPSPAREEHEEQWGTVPAHR